MPTYLPQFFRTFGKYFPFLLLSLLILLSLPDSGPRNAGAFATTTSFDSLEIHVINVGWGASIFVRGPNGTKILIEAGNTGKGKGKVVPYLKSIGILPIDTLDYTIAGHQHSDHLGGMSEVVDSGYTVRYKNYYNGSTYSTTAVTRWKNAAMLTPAGALDTIPVGKQIDLGNGAKLTCIARNGKIIGGGTVAVSDENDRSIAALIQYGGFDFLWASDLGGGSESCTGRYTASQVDVETAVITAISPGGAHPMISSGGIDVLYVNHHGSESSTNSNWMNMSRPAVAVISTGSGQTSGWDFPRINVVDHVLLAQSSSCVTVPPALVLQTEEGNPTGSSTSYDGYCVGDIVIKTDGVSKFRVSADGAVTEGPDERIAAGLPRLFDLDDPGPLPVELASFNAMPSGLGAELRWTTSTEVNSERFDIQRSDVSGQQSAVGIQPSAARWVTVASVAAHGTSTSVQSYSYDDMDVPAGSYVYRLKQIDLDGSFKYSSVVNVEVGLAPKVFSLSQNYPNPFNPSTSIQFTVPSDGRASLKVFDVLGREVATLVDDEVKAGVYRQATFDASKMPSGIYFARLQFGQKQLLKKMVFAK